MAIFQKRTVEEIFNSLLEYKDTIPELTGLNSNVSDFQTLLDDLQSDSVVSRWILYLYIHAYNTWILENLMEQQVDELQNIKDTNITGTAQWYSFMAKKFQYGDTLVVDESTNFVPSYDVVNESNYIIGSAATEEVSGKLYIKIRGLVNDLLTEDELNAFTAYMNKIKFAGTKIAIQNLASDKLKIVANIVYDGQVLLEDLKDEVENAIIDYIGNIAFDSTFYRNRLIDSIQAINGVIDVEINTLQSRVDSISRFTDIVHNYKSLSGYMTIDSAYPLSSFLTYTIK